MHRWMMSAAPSPAPAGTQPRRRLAHPAVVDGFLALIAAGLALESLLGPGRPGTLAAGDLDLTGPDLVDVALLLLGTLSLAWRRRSALLVLGLAGGAFFLYQAHGYAPPALALAALVALYTVGATARFPISVAAMAALIGGLVLADVTRSGALTDDDRCLAYVVSVVAVWLAGHGMRLSRARTTLAEEQSARLAREAATATRLAVEQEKTRIARDLHDIVAQNVCVIVAQAGASRRVFDTQPESARQTLRSIEATGRAALTEIRRTLDILQTEAPSRPQPGRPFLLDQGQQPGLDQFPGLAGEIERAGLPVRLAVRGDPVSLPAAVDRGAYGIVRQALTNSLDHSGGSQAYVLLDYHPERLVVQVHDDGTGGRGDVVLGHGIVGMWQRAAVLGGRLTIGPGPRGGYRVTASLPVDGQPR
jgi:signal transduction histidine kinase